MFGFFLGIIVYFIIMRVVENLNHRAGMECGYDCTTCSLRCAGYHCGVMRSETSSQPLDADFEEIE